MANTDTPRGFTPVRYLSGQPYTGAVNQYSVAAGNATAILIGDPVTLAGTGQTINGNVYQDVVRSATGDAVTGICVGVKPDTRDSTIYRAASTQRILFVADDPDLLFEIQEGATGTAFTANDIGLNANFVVNSGSTTTGMSGVILDNTTEATTNTLDVKLWGFQNRADNAIGSSAKWLVRLNKSRLVDQVAGV